MKTKKSKKGKKRLLIFLFIFTIIILAIAILLPYYLVLDVKEIDSKILVYDLIGVDTRTDMLSFGGVQPGGSSTRKMEADNKYNQDVILEIVPLGDMKMFVSKSSYLIPKGEKHEVAISAYVPKGTEKKEYTGKVRFVIKRRLL
jgi:hypothetical protein